MAAEAEVKVRFVAQGILTIPKNDLPPDFEKLDREQAWEWINEWWDKEVGPAEIMQGVENCEDLPGDPCPGLLEIFEPGQSEYRTIAVTNEFAGYWQTENAYALHDGPIPGLVGEEKGAKETDANLS